MTNIRSSGWKKAAVEIHHILARDRLYRFDKTVHRFPVGVVGEQRLVKDQRGDFTGFLLADRQAGQQLLAHAFNVIRQESRPPQSVGCQVRSNTAGLQPAPCREGGAVRAAAE